MKIERVISRFDKTSEEFLEEVNVDKIDLEILKNIFQPSLNDPLMYNPYTIHEKEAIEVKNIINMEFYFEKYFYQIDCFQA